MTFTSTVLVAFSSILMLHSGYSAHEHSLTSPHPLPADIAIEAVISASLMCFGIVLSSEALRPISYRVWTGQLEREQGAGPYAWLDDCPGFLDIRAKRAEFREWMKAKEALDG